VLRALLDAMPKSRWVQLRVPIDTVDFFPTPLNEATAFAGTDAARIGFPNQCFLTNATDAGTWYDRNWVANPPALHNYMAQATRYMSVGGETCQVEPDAYKQPSGCVNALAELTRYHWSVLNAEFYEPTLQRWKSEGCYDTIAKRLGYRFEPQNAQVQPSVRPGGEMRVDFSIRNSGFAGPSNARDLQIVLRRRSQGQFRLQHPHRQLAKRPRRVGGRDGFQPTLRHRDDRCCRRGLSLCGRSLVSVSERTDSVAGRP
jgi:hypothetical protein